MARYTEKNVLKIKKDVAAENTKLVGIVSKREAEEKELLRLQALTRAEELKVSKIWEAANAGLLLASNAKKKLLAECADLRLDKRTLQAQVQLWKNLLSETVGRLQKINVKRGDSFLESLIVESRKILSNLVSRRKAEEKVVGELEEERKALEKGNAALEEQEGAFTEKVDTLDLKIKEGEKDLATISTTTEELKKRELNVEAMEIRLTPEFKRLYRISKDKRKRKK